MADEPEDDVLDLETDSDELDEQQEDIETEGDDADDDDLIIGFEGDEEAAPASQGESTVIRELRAKVRELQKERDQSAKPKIEVGPKPDLWDDCEGDPDKFEAALIDWNKRKVQADEADANQGKEREQIQAEWQREHGTYETQKAKLARPDFENAEVAIETAMTQAQQSVLILAAKDKAALVYALGRSPSKLAEVAKITNPIKLAVAVAELERNLKVQPRRKGPEPEERMRGSAPMSTTAKDKEIAKLEAKAARGGDVTDTLKRLRELRAK